MVWGSSDSCALSACHLEGLLGFCQTVPLCSHTPPGALSCSAFPPRMLLVLFVEIDYWERLLFETPHYVMNVAERAEDLRILRENLLLVARDYNRWAAVLGPRSSSQPCVYRSCLRTWSVPRGSHPSSFFRPETHFPISRSFGPAASSIP